MATATDFLKLVKPAVGEKYALSILNGNFDKIDAGVKALDALDATVGNIKLSIATSPTLNSSYDGRDSVFYKIQFGDNNKGIIIADIRLKFLNNNGFYTPDLQETSVKPPAGYKFRQSSGVQVAVASGVGANYTCQLQLSGGTSGSIKVRRDNSSASSRTINSVVSAIFIGEWNGLTT